MLKNSKSELVKRILSDGPKRAKDIVRAFKKEGIGESTAFYWLKKLRENREIRKAGSIYELISLEEADEDEFEFLLEKLEGKNSAVMEAAAEDLRILCDEKRVSQIERVWSFIEKAIGGSYGPKVRKKAVHSLRSIAQNSLMLGDDGVIRRIREEFGEKLEEAVLEGDSDFAYRDAAAEVLDVVHEGEENFRVNWEILAELLMLENSPSVGLTVWRRLLDKHFDERRMKIRENLYSLLESEERSVREAVLLLFDELRARERRFP